MSTSSERRRVGREKAKEAKHEEKAADRRAKAADAREKAREKTASAGRTTSQSTSKQRLNAAKREEKKAAKLDKEAVAESKAEARASVRVGKAEDAVRGAVEAERKKDEAADKRRRREELAHARQVASERTAGSALPAFLAPANRHVKLALLVASPSGEERIRVDREAREIRETLKRATLGSRVDVDVWPAATFEDIVHALNDDKPDIVHFSGHGTVDGLIFDGTETADPEGNEFPYDYVSRALQATDWSPALVVLNACYSFAGVEEILAATPAVIAMTESVTDIGAKSFGAKLYAGIGSGQSLQSSFNQAKLALDMVTGEGEKAELVVLDSVDASNYRLIQPED